MLYLVYLSYSHILDKGSLEENKMSVAQVQVNLFWVIEHYSYCYLKLHRIDKKLRVWSLG